MSKDKKHKDFVHRAYYEGGTEALKKFINLHLKYPAEAKEKGIQGAVKLQFDVDYQGKVHHVKVISGIGYGCDEEAVRIAKLLEYKVPKTYRLKVGFKKKLNIHFKLKKKEVTTKTPKKTSYTYSISSPNKTTGSYSYSIKIGES